MQDYRKLAVWRKAHGLALRVRAAVARMPRVGYASLRAQTTASAESIAFNIVEGCGARTRKDFARFLDIAIKSSMELEYQLQLSRDYGIMTCERWEPLSDSTIEVRRMLFGLRRAVLDADRTEQGTG